MLIYLEDILPPMKSKKEAEFRRIWAEVEKIRNDPESLKALDALIKLTAPQ